MKPFKPNSITLPISTKSTPNSWITKWAGFFLTDFFTGSGEEKEEEKEHTSGQSRRGTQCRERTTHHRRQVTPPHLTVLLSQRSLTFINGRSCFEVWSPSLCPTCWESGPCVAFYRTWHCLAFFIRFPFIFSFSFTRGIFYVSMLRRILADTIRDVVVDSPAFFKL